MSLKVTKGQKSRYKGQNRSDFDPPPISRLLGITRPPVARNFWKFGCRPNFLCSSKWPATFFEIWPLNWNMTPRSNTFVLFLKKSRHNYFFLNWPSKDSVLSKYFFVIWEKALRSFWGIWGHMGSNFGHRQK